MIRQVAVVVEGQTEEAFVGDVLRPWAEQRNTSVQPLVIHTSRAASGQAFRGGGSRWRPYERLLKRLLGESHWSLVTTMLDFYGYPGDAPGADCCAGIHSRPRVCVDLRESAMALALADDRRFLAHITLHEFETLVIGAARGRESLLGSREFAAALDREADEVGGDVELLDGAPDTAPSKRVQRAWMGSLPYSKTRDGIGAIHEAGIEAVIDTCPHFKDWVSRVTAADS